MKKYTKVINGLSVVKTRQQIVITKGNMNIYWPNEEMILADGWVEYTPKVEVILPDEHEKDSYAIMQEIVLEQYNSRIDISDNEALDRMLVIYDWDYYIGKQLKAGQVMVYEGTVFRVRQDIAEVLSVYPPSLATAALYEKIVLTATGEADDPIPYTPPMEIFNGKHYIEDSVVYRCTRDSDTALSHKLSALVGLYVEVV